MKYILLILILLMKYSVVFSSNLHDRNKIDPVKNKVIQTHIEKDRIQLATANNGKKELALAEYKKLEKARRNLDRRLSKLKAITWGMKLPPDEAKKINREMLQGYRLLKSKKLLGAFHRLEDIQKELIQVEYAYQELGKIEANIRRQQ